MNKTLNLLGKPDKLSTFGLGLPWIAVGFYFYMVHGEGKVMMSVGALLVTLGIIGISVL